MPLSPHCAHSAAYKKNKIGKDKSSLLSSETLSFGFPFDEERYDGSDVFAVNGINSPDVFGVTKG